jgi:hypothetical protein
VAGPAPPHAGRMIRARPHRPGCLVVDVGEQPALGLVAAQPVGRSGLRSGRIGSHPSNPRLATPGHPGASMVASPRALQAPRGRSTASSVVRRPRSGPPGRDLDTPREPLLSGPARTLATAHDRPRSQDLRCDRRADGPYETAEGSWRPRVGDQAGPIRSGPPPQARHWPPATASPPPAKVAHPEDSPWISTPSPPTRRLALSPAAPRGAPTRPSRRPRTAPAADHVGRPFASRSIPIEPERHR